MPLKASMSPSTTPRTRPCAVQATSGSSVAQFGACASALEVVAANRSSAKTFLKWEIVVSFRSFAYETTMTIEVLAALRYGCWARTRLHAVLFPRSRLRHRLLGEWIGPYLDVNRARLGALAAFHHPWDAVSAGAPQPPALPAGVWIIDAAVKALCEEPQRVWNAQHDHLSVLIGDEPVVEVGRGDRDIFTEPHRIVMVHPGVVARLGAGVFQPFETRAGILVVGKSFGTVVAGRIRPVERALAFAAVEADERAVRARAPKHSVLVDIAATNANAFFRDGVELRDLGVGIEAHEPRCTGKHVDGVPDRAVARMRHHGVGAGTRDAHVLAGLRRRAGFGVFVDLAIAVGVENERRPALRLHCIPGVIPHLGVHPAGNGAGPGEP